jgi:hypothetical protein
MQDLVAVHGEFKGRLKIASGWLIVTQHSSGPGEIGIMDCRSNPACLDGRQDRDVHGLFGKRLRVGRCFTFSAKWVRC